MRAAHGPRWHSRDVGSSTRMTPVAMFVLLAITLVPVPGHAALVEPAPSATPAAPVSLDWRQTIPSQRPRGWLSEVTTWSHGFAALGEVETGRPTIWVSPDGSSWTSQALPFLKRRQPHLGALDGRLVIVAAVPRGYSDRLASWVSRDGQRWRRAPDRRVMTMPRMDAPYFLAVSRPVEVDGGLVVYGDWEGSRGDSLAGRRRFAWRPLRIPERGAQAQRGRRLADARWAALDTAADHAEPRRPRVRGTG